MFKIIFYVTAISVALSILPTAVDAQCPPPSWSRSSLLELRQKQFELPDSIKLSTLAVQLIFCLQSSDPVLRDQVAYEGLSLWMRDKKLDAESALKIVLNLSAWLQPNIEDAEGFTKPFAALVLAELVRMDRIEPYLSSPQRQALVDTTTNYLSSIKDYRGYDNQQGWRHGVAHSADLVLQLALNPHIDVSQQQQLAQAVSSQIIPSNEHFYIYGEEQRLARAVFYLIQRDSINMQWWKTWIEQLTDNVQTQELFQSQAGLAKRHNLMSFFSIMYVYFAENGTEAMKMQLLPTVIKSIAMLG